MSYRTLLATLIVLATVAFVVGVSLETSDEHHESPVAAAGEAGHHDEQGEETHAVEANGEEHHSEFRPAGIDLESTPLIVLAALASLGLAALAWGRPRWLPALALVFLAMAAFGALDVAEVVHQADVHEHALAVLAGFVAALHLAAAFVALRMTQAVRG